MKKRAIFIIALLILPAILNLIITLAQEPPLPVGVQDPEELNKELREKASSDYLKQEWTKILEKNQFGRVILFISNLFKALSPIFKLLIGVEYSLSWLFFLALGAWIAILIIIYQLLKDIFQTKKWIALSISAIIPAIAAQFGTFEKTVSFFVPLLKSIWSVMALIIIAIIVLYIYSMIMKKFGKILEEKRKKEKEERREQKSETLEKITDIKLKGSGAK